MSVLLSNSNITQNAKFFPRKMSLIAKLKCKRQIKNEKQSGFDLDKGQLYWHI